MLLCGSIYAALEPWHGPTVIALSEQHGVDLADLPAVPLIALGLVLARSGVGRRARWADSRAAAACAIALGAILVAGIFDPRTGAPLVPALGGTFGRITQHVDGVRALPVNRWTYLAGTYDGRTYRLYVNGTVVSSAAASGPILKTDDPLWLGGNRPYGEYFRGVVDELRIYRRALRPTQVRAAMATPIAAQRRLDAPDLAAAYAFDSHGARTATDASRHGNTGTIRGATYTRDGRYGGGLRFDGDGQVIRIPASPSLNLRSAMTLMAWVKPSESQSGWRTIIERQTDAYYLDAGGGRQDAGRLERIDRLRFAVVVLLLAALGLALAGGASPWALSGRRWYWPVVLFVAGSLVDVAFAQRDTMLGPLLVAIWCGTAARLGAVRVALHALTAIFAVVTVGALLHPAVLPLPADDGGVVRSAALGLTLCCVALLSLRDSPRARQGGAGALLGHGRN